jgi:DNA topoisomerase 2-associated protein PAT1
VGKGKKFLPRIHRLLNNQRQLTMLTLFIACFSQLDVVIRAPILDSLEDSPEKAAVEKQTVLFASCLQAIQSIVARGSLRLLTGLLGLFLDRNDVLMVARTKVCRPLSLNE